MGLPYKDDPKIAHIVVVTAAHVFEGISGDNATLNSASSGRHLREPSAINSR